MPKFLPSIRIDGEEYVRKKLLPPMKLVREALYYSRKNLIAYVDPSPIDVALDQLKPYPEESTND